MVIVELASQKWNLLYHHICSNLSIKVRESLMVNCRNNQYRGLNCFLYSIISLFLSSLSGKISSTSVKKCHSNWEKCNTQVINYEKNECQSQLNLTDMNSLFLFRELALIIVIVCRKNTLLYITVFCLFILFSFLCVGMGCLDKEIFDIQMM